MQSYTIGGNTMKEKFKKGMALVLATAMLIPSAVSAQTAVDKGNILKDMETKGRRV